MERCDYPADRMKVIVVDGGSTDRTVEFVNEEISKGKKIEIICLNGSRSKVDQVNHILASPGEEIMFLQMQTHGLSLPASVSL